MVSLTNPLAFLTVPASGEPTPPLMASMGEFLPQTISAGSAIAKTSTERISILRRKTEDVPSSTPFILGCQPLEQNLGRLICARGIRNLKKIQFMIFVHFSDTELYEYLADATHTTRPCWYQHRAKERPGEPCTSKFSKHLKFWSSTRRDSQWFLVIVSFRVDVTVNAVDD